MNLREDILDKAGILNEMATIDFRLDVMNSIAKKDYKEAAQRYYRNAYIRQKDREPSKKSTGTTAPFKTGNFPKSFDKLDPKVLEIAKKTTKSEWEQFDKEYAKYALSQSKPKPRKNQKGTLDDKGDIITSRTSKKNLSELNNKVSELVNVSKVNLRAISSIGSKVKSVEVAVDSLEKISAISKESSGEIKTYSQILDSLIGLERKANFFEYSAEVRKWEVAIGVQTVDFRQRVQEGKLQIIKQNFREKFDTVREDYKRILTNYSKVSGKKLNLSNINTTSIENFFTIVEKVKKDLVEKLGEIETEVEIKKINNNDIGAAEKLRKELISMYSIAPGDTDLYNKKQKEGMIADNIDTIKTANLKTLENIRKALVKELIEKIQFFNQVKKVNDNNSRGAIGSKASINKKTMEKIQLRAKAALRTEPTGESKAKKAKAKVSRDSDFLIGDDKKIIFKSGTWKGGIFRGVFRDGTFTGGDFNGVFKNGTFKSGRWYSGTWENGKWENGYIYDWNKDKFVLSNESPKDYSGSFQNVDSAKGKLSKNKSQLGKMKDYDLLTKSEDRAKEAARKEKELAKDKKDDKRRMAEYAEKQRENGGNIKMEGLSFKEQIICESVGYAGGNFRKNYSATNLLKAFDNDVKNLSSIREAIEINVSFYGKATRDLFEFFGDNAFLLHESVKINQPLLFEGAADNQKAMKALANDGTEEEATLTKIFNFIKEKNAGFNTKRDSAIVGAKGDIVRMAGSGKRSVEDFLGITKGAEKFVPGDVSKFGVGNSIKDGTREYTDFLSLVKDGKGEGAREGINSIADKIGNSAGKLGNKQTYLDAVTNVKGNPKGLLSSIGEFLAKAWGKIKEYGKDVLENLSAYIQKGATWATSIATKGISWLGTASPVAIAIPAVLLAGAGIGGGIVLVNKLRKKAKKAALTKQEEEIIYKEIAKRAKSDPSSIVSVNSDVKKEMAKVIKDLTGTKGKEYLGTSSVLSKEDIAKIKGVVAKK